MAHQAAHGAGRAADPSSPGVARNRNATVGARAIARTTKARRCRQAFCTRAQWSGQPLVPADGEAFGVLPFPNSRDRGPCRFTKPAAECLELVGRDLAVVHQAGHLPQPAVGGQLVELRLGDDAVREEALELLAIRLGLLPGGLASLLASLAPDRPLRLDRIEDRRLLARR